MKNKVVRLLTGYVEMPEAAKIVDISAGGPVDFVAVISDRKGEVEPLVVLSDSFMGAGSELSEDEIVNRAIAGFPEYQKIKAEELPYPERGASRETWLKWSESFRLGLFPLEMFEGLDEDLKYKLHRNK